ncbi:hypothetical protein [Lactobacillus amylolyticus]|uniref:hypothetical protein n=1 Tax=Lactobacillus amylolyticus TaxID=83683 RepID=UPI002492189A|nr:hypothetical protein [Lactobacillus amylolyticus]
MSVDNIESGVKNLGKVKAEREQKEIVNRTNTILKHLLNDATKGVISGEIKIRDTTDLRTIFDIFTKVNGLENGGLDGNTIQATPKLNTGEENIIENAVNVNTEVEHTEDGDTEKVKNINLSDIAKLSPDNIKHLATEKEKEQNNESN